MNYSGGEGREVKTWRLANRSMLALKLLMGADGTENRSLYYMELPYGTF
jgi:hypothetical protein